MWRKFQQWAKMWRRREQPRAIILAYHRITEIDSDPQLLCVAPQNFADNLRVLRQSYQTLSLQALVERLSQDQIPHRSVVITFDDGYADNLHQAQPLLQQYSIPATVFVTSSSIDQPQEFWWDDLERLLLLPGTLPERLSLTINGNNYFWELGDSSHYSETTYKKYRHWHVLNPEIPTRRHEIYLALCSLLRPLSGEKRQGILQKLITWAGVNEAGRATHRTLTLSEVRELSTRGFIEVGVHCATHPVLSALSKTQQYVEIHHSKRDLESLLEQPVTSFSYPYGTRFDYTSTTVKIVRDAGFSCACSNFLDLVWQGTDRFQLPRFIIRNWSGQEFAERLNQWFQGDISDEYLTG
jgi:peptidoglycan/xylan/chitin deacetylase (PgdA/CDA1 family)